MAGLEGLRGDVEVREPRALVLRHRAERRLQASVKPEHVQLLHAARAEGELNGVRDRGVGRGGRALVPSPVVAFKGGRRSV